MSKTYQQQRHGNVRHGMSHSPEYIGGSVINNQGRNNLRDSLRSKLKEASSE